MSTKQKNAQCKI